LKPLENFLFNKGLQIHEIDYFKDIHGGTVRLTIYNKNKIQTWFKNYPRENYFEMMLIDSLYDIGSKYNFTLKTYDLQAKTMQLFEEIYKRKETIHILSASAKGNTFLNFCFNEAYFDKYTLCYDENKLKCNKYLPGTKIKIVHPEELLKNEYDHPDYIFITVWNFKDELIKRFREKYKYKNKFIVAIPNLEII
jgi:hypothetical protein